MPDRLREHEQVVAAGAGQVVVARQREDWGAWRIGFNVVGNVVGVGVPLGRSKTPQLTELMRQHNCG